MLDRLLKHCVKLKKNIFHVMSVLKQMTLKNHSNQKEAVSQKDSQVLSSNEMQSQKNDSTNSLTELQTIFQLIEKLTI